MLESTSQTASPAAALHDAGHRTYVYEIRLDPRKPAKEGEIDARDPDDARRLLRVRYARAKLPAGTSIMEKQDYVQRQDRARSAKLRQLLRTLTGHHAWLKDLSQGERADLSGLNLAGVNLANTDLSLADMAGADLSGANFSKARLQGANLVRANLQDVDFRGADLSDADLRGAILSGAKLRGADLRRANLMGCTISPKLLHEALRCKKA